jgi:predicted alpha/beta-fold hydrolase
MPKGAKSVVAFRACCLSARAIQAMGQSLGSNGLAAFGFLPREGEAEADFFMDIA